MKLQIYTMKIYKGNLVNDLGKTPKGKPVWRELFIYLCTEKSNLHFQQKIPDLSFSEISRFSCHIFASKTVPQYAVRNCTNSSWLLCLHINPYCTELYEPWKSCHCFCPQKLCWPFLYGCLDLRVNFCYTIVSICMLYGLSIMDRIFSQLSLDLCAENFSWDSCKFSTQKFALSPLLA